MFSISSTAAATGLALRAATYRSMRFRRQQKWEALLGAAQQ